MTVFEAIGVAGFLSYISSFALLQLRLISGNGYLYPFLNVLGAAMVLVSLVESFNLASLLIQISWIVIGVGGMTLKFWTDMRKRKAPQKPRTTG